MIVPDFHLGVMGRNHFLRHNPVDRINEECVTINFFFSSHNNHVPFSIEPDDIERLSFCQAETPSLADGIERDAFMFSQDIPSPIHNGTRFKRLFYSLGQKVMIRRFLNKTDLLTFGLVMDSKTLLKRHPPHFLFSKLSQWK